MTKHQPLKDPGAFLKDLIARKGESQQYACVFHGANLTFNPHDHAHSDTYDDAIDFLRRVMVTDDEYCKLVSLLSHVDSVQEHYRFKEYFGLTGLFAYIRSDSEGFSVTFSFPSINASRFSVDVEVISHIALLWAKIVGKELTQVRAFINYAFLRWEDMEEENLLYTEFESD